MSTNEHDPWYADEECVQCDEPLDHTGYPEDSEYIGEYGAGSWYETLNDDMLGHLCLYCRESWDEHANTLTVADERGQVAKINYEDGIIMDHAHYDRDLEPIGELDGELENAILEIVSGTSWVSTDAWRGHTTVPDDADGYTKAKSGWHSSITQTDASDVVNGLLDGEYHHYGDHGLNVPIIGVFSTTSNVMSLGVDLYVPDGHENSIVELFENASSRRDGSL